MRYLYLDQRDLIDLARSQSNALGRLKHLINRGEACVVVSFMCPQMSALKRKILAFRDEESGHDHRHSLWPRDWRVLCGGHTAIATTSTNTDLRQHQIGL